MVMAEEFCREDRRPRASRWWFVLGCVLAVALLTGLAEIYLDFFPPRDLKEYLGDESPMTGIYRADSDFAVAYRSWEDFCTDNALRLRPYRPVLQAGGDKPIWASFRT